MTDAEGNKITRAEWISAAALILSAGSTIFAAGVVWADVQDHTRRIDRLETASDELIKRVERIDANVEFLAELAREERRRTDR